AGYSYATPPADVPTEQLYRCSTGQDHFVSLDPGCEGQTTDESLGYAGISGDIPSSGMTSNGCPITPEQAQMEYYLFWVLNQHRAAAGAPPLQPNETLAVASREHACDMFQQQSASHDGSDGS